MWYVGNAVAFSWTPPRAGDRAHTVLKSQVYEGLTVMARTKFSVVREEFMARPGADEALARARVETLEQIRLYELRPREAPSEFGGGRDQEAG
jgi:hypothetical protein